MELGKLIGQGRTAEVFNYGDDKIVKLFRNNIPKTIVEMEYNISLELNSLGLPVAEVFELLEHNKRFGIVYEKISGVSMLRMAATKPWSIAKQAKKFAETHKSIQRSIKIEISSQKQKLKDDISRADLLEQSAKDRLYAYIDKLEDNSILCHGDFHPDNILLTKDRAVVIDWMTASIGNPLADVARTSVIFKYAYIPEEKSFIEKKLINFIRSKFYSEYINHYIKISNSNIEEIEKWELPIAAARLIEWLPQKEKEVLLDFVNKRLDML